MGSRKKLTAAARRAQLIEVARKVFAEKGYEATSVEEIASHIAALAWMGLRNLPEKPDPIGERSKRRE